MVTPPLTDKAPLVHRHAHAVVLAAGAGRRFGGRKMLAEWEGRPLVLAAVEIALAAPVAGVTVVLGAEAEEVAAACVSVGDARLGLVHNRDWQSGIASSLRAGIAALPATAEQVIVFLGDMPRVPRNIAARLIEALGDGATAALVEVDRRPGHPVAFTRAAFDVIGRASGDRGARSLLAGLSGCVTIPWHDEGCVFDVDHRPLA